ncbi:MAG: hypothetical protein IJU68_02460 [Bacteroidales bacterium]|nr:hypothetical protein [Bacteroidales bacterium]
MKAFNNKFFLCLSILLFYISLCGCGDKSAQYPDVCYTPLEYGSFGIQKANYLIVWNSSIEWVNAGDLSCWTWCGNNYNDTQVVKADEFALTLWTKEHSWDEIMEDSELLSYYRPGEPEIDAQLIANSGRDNLYSPIGSPLSYRLEGLKNLSITCEQTIFGLPPSTDITDKFVIFSRTPVINSDKQYLGVCPKFSLLSDYLGLKPLVFDSLTIVFKRSDIPSEKIENCRFRLYLELDNGQTFIAQSKAVTFSER